MLQHLKPIGPLEYKSYYDDGLRLSHRLTCDIGSDLRDHEQLLDKMHQIMEPFDQQGQNHIYFLQDNIFYVYFDTKEAAMLFKLYWTPRSIFGRL